MLILQEGRDKQFLLSRIQDLLTNGPDAEKPGSPTKKKSPPAPIMEETEASPLPPKEAAGQTTVNMNVSDDYNI